MKNEPPSTASESRQAAAREIEGWIKTLAHLPEPEDLQGFGNREYFVQKNIEARAALQGIRRTLLYGE